MEFSGDSTRQTSNHSETGGESGHQALSWHSVFTPLPHHDKAGKLVTCKDSTTETVLANHTIGLPDCRSEALSQKDLSLLPALKLEMGEPHGKFKVGTADAEAGESPVARSAEDSNLGLKGSYERESSRSYLHASINQKQGGLEEVFADEHLSSHEAMKRMAEPDVWTVGTVSAGHEQKLYSSDSTNVWVGVGATVNPVFDRELREKTSAAPTTVFTNLRVEF